MQHALFKFGTTSLDIDFEFGRTLNIDYPTGPELGWQTMGMMVNKGESWSIRKKNREGRFVVPNHVAGKLTQRRYAMPRDPKGNIIMGDAPALSEITVSTDYMNGNQGSHQIVEGWDWTRVCYVYGLETNSPDDISELYSDAEIALVSIIGNRGSAGPDMSSGFDVNAPTYLAGFRFEAIGADAVKILVGYKGYRIVDYKFGGGQGQIESNLDANGDVIDVSYTYPADFGINPTPGSSEPTGDASWAGVTDTVSKLINKPVFEALITFNFIVTDGWTIDSVPVGESIDAMAWLKSFQGFVYGDTVTYDPTDTGYLEFPGDCWYVEQVDGDSSDGNLSFECNFILHLRVVSWNTTVTYTMRNTGDPPADLVPGTGQKAVQVSPFCLAVVFDFFPN